jgi:hypothetical protein
MDGSFNNLKNVLAVLEESEEHKLKLNFFEKYAA